MRGRGTNARLALVTKNKSLAAITPFSPTDTWSVRFGAAYTIIKGSFNISLMAYFALKNALQKCQISITIMVTVGEIKENKLRRLRTIGARTGQTVKLVAQPSLSLVPLSLFAVMLPDSAKFSSWCRRWLPKEK